MKVIDAIHPESSTGKQRELFLEVQHRLGMIPNFLRTLANSPAMLEMYLNVSDALESGALPAKLRARIALAVAELNSSPYCISANSAIGSTAGLSDEEIMDSRKGVSPDSKINAVLCFVRQIVEKRGRVSPEEVERLRDAGYTDLEITEVVANVALSMLSNYFNLIAGTEIDFPEAPKLKEPGRVLTSFGEGSGLSENRSR